jgi:hypothetical protein
MIGYYIKYCEILGRVMKEAKGQHYFRLVAGSDKTIGIIAKHEAGKLHLTEQILSLLINDETVRTQK